MYECLRRRPPVVVVVIVVVVTIIAFLIDFSHSQLPEHDSRKDLYLSKALTQLLHLRSAPPSTQVKNTQRL
jgi:hypothetical protein